MYIKCKDLKKTRKEFLEEAAKLAGKGERPPKKPSKYDDLSVLAYLEKAVANLPFEVAQVVLKDFFEHPIASSELMIHKRIIKRLRDYQPPDMSSWSHEQKQAYWENERKDKDRTTYAFLRLYQRNHLR